MVDQVQDENFCDVDFDYRLDDAFKDEGMMIFIVRQFQVPGCYTILPSSCTRKVLSSTASDCKIIEGGFCSQSEAGAKSLPNYEVGNRSPKHFAQGNSVFNSTICDQNCKCSNPKSTQYSEGNLQVCAYTGRMENGSEEATYIERNIVPKYHNNTISFFERNFGFRSAAQTGKKNEFGFPCFSNTSDCDCDSFMREAAKVLMRIVKEAGTLDSVATHKITNHANEVKNIDVFARNKPLFSNNLDTSEEKASIPKSPSSRATCSETARGTIASFREMPFPTFSTRRRRKRAAPVAGSYKYRLNSPTGNNTAIASEMNNSSSEILKRDNSMRVRGKERVNIQEVKTLHTPSDYLRLQFILADNSQSREYPHSKFEIPTTPCKSKRKESITSENSIFHPYRIGPENHPVTDGTATRLITNKSVLENITGLTDSNLISSYVNHLPLVPNLKSATKGNFVHNPISQYCSPLKGLRMEEHSNTAHFNNFLEETGNGITKFGSREIEAAGIRTREPKAPEIDYQNFKSAMHNEEVDAVYIKKMILKLHDIRVDKSEIGSSGTKRVHESTEAENPRAKKKSKPELMLRLKNNIKKTVLGNKMRVKKRNSGPHSPLA